MSSHEWFCTMYGIEMPGTRLNGERALAFIANHKEAMFDEDALPETPEEAIEFADRFLDSDENAEGPAALIVEAAGGAPFYAASDQYGSEYVGIYALSNFPWDKPAESWQSMTIEKVENTIRPLMEELYGTCPEFYEQTIWMYG